jgi:AraC family transcriptional regulator
MDQDNLYLQRINLVLNYIREHLNDDLSVNTLAQVAYFSPFHFHRIFKTITGETLNDVVVRLRLERAVALLRSSPKLPISEAAFTCGFASASNFARAFKNRYGISARSWDRQTPLKERKNGQVLEGFPHYTVEKLSEVEQTAEFEVRLRPMPLQRLAYVRVFSSYQVEPILKGYQRLIEWYQAGGGNMTQTTVYGMSQDDPEITPLNLCRFDWCLSVSDDWKLDDDINEWCFPACHIAYIHCVGDIYKVDRAWQYMFRYWLPRSRFQPDNLPAMEIYRRLPAEIGWETFDLECAVPVVAL